MRRNLDGSINQSLPPSPIGEAEGRNLHLPIHQPPDIHGIVVFQFIGKQGGRKALVTYRSDKTLYGSCSHRGRTAVSGSWIRTAMHHSVANLNACGIIIDDQPSCLLFQQGNQVLTLPEIFLCAMDTHRKMPM